MEKILMIGFLVIVFLSLSVSVEAGPGLDDKDKPLYWGDDYPGGINDSRFSDTIYIDKNGAVKVKPWYLAGISSTTSKADVIYPEELQVRVEKLEEGYRAFVAYIEYVENTLQFLEAREEAFTIVFKMQIDLNEALEARIKELEERLDK